SRNTSSTGLDDMFDMPCCHDKNASISSSCCIANNVEKTKHFMGQVMAMNGVSRNTSSSSLDAHICLMARESKITSTLKPNIYCDDEDEYNEEEDDNDAS